MLAKIKTRIHKELAQFDRLNRDTKRLLVSMILFAAAYPLIGVFVNAYIWRESNSLSLVAMFILARYATISFGFYTNGLLLRYFRAKTLYPLGLIAFALSTIIVIFIPQVTLAGIIIAGTIRGFGSAFFWANRNIIESIITDKSNRILYSGLEQSYTSVIGLAVPFLTGWFLVLGEKLGWYTVNTAYQATAIIAATLLLLSGGVMLRAKVKVVKASSISMKNPSSAWKSARLASSLLGSMGGVMAFIPSIAILTLVGTEEILGTVQALSTIFSAGMIYIIGRKAAAEHRTLIYAAGAGLFVLSSAIFGISFSILGALALIVGHGVGAPLRWLSINTTVLDTIDQEVSSLGESRRYSYVFDKEVFLNIGRVIGLVTMLLIMSYFSETTALRIMPAIVSLSLIALYFPLRKLSKTLAKNS